MLSFNKKSLIAAVGALFLAGMAIAQSTVPQVQSARPFLDLVQIIPGGGASAQNQYTPWASVTNVYGYYKAGTGTQNQTYPFGSNVTFASFQNASAMNTAYIYLASAPFDGAQDCFFSIGGITNITMYGGTTSQTLNNAVTTLAANTRVCYNYSASNTAWDRD